LAPTADNQFRNFLATNSGPLSDRRAQERLKRYRAAVLHAATTGELTRAWREAQRKKKKTNIETGETLLRRFLAGRRVRWEQAELERQRERGEIPINDHWKYRYSEPQIRDVSNRWHHHKNRFLFRC
jgi:type I restriction enzyme S subunit